MKGDWALLDQLKMIPAGLDQARPGTSAVQGSMMCNVHLEVPQESDVVYSEIPDLYSSMQKLVYDTVLNVLGVGDIGLSHEFAAGRFEKCYTG
jgi:hypothetical protein